MAACRAAGDQAQARLAAAGYVLASELRAAGVDMTFAPVLDIDYGRSAVIGNRSLGSERHEVERNARALMSGLRLAGMANCGKHFPVTAGPRPTAMLPARPTIVRQRKFGVIFRSIAVWHSSSKAS